MKDSLVPGLKHEATLYVDDSLIVPNVSSNLNAFADMPPVFATAFMVGFIEAACIEAIASHLHYGEHSVGVHVDLSHIAATPSGMKVFADVELVSIDKNKLLFRIIARDETGLISEGTHERAVIDMAKFGSSIQKKAKQIA